ncbi:MAG: CopG family ribbon-helix-helix protein [Sulfolobales archaeon]|nr:CopG family ribbon-helix-helix protein [Sulfolobales archaeon]MCX8208546.1 CopG family ribbon-helix-helix protein [Sulfolobales archaeon]MDW8010416.1 CopG family ribbon-helix-helix protein [Sulfolobales archaeon]
MEKLVKSSGVGSLSKIVQEGLRLYIAEHSWRSGGEVVGALGVLYDHDVDRVDEELTNVQHKYMEAIISTLHVHLDARHCLLVISVRGNTSTIKALADELEKLRGVKLVRYMLMPKHAY